MKRINFVLNWLAWHKIKVTRSLFEIYPEFFRSETWWPGKLLLYPTSTKSLPVFSCSKLTIETLEQGLKCLNLTIKTPERHHWHHSGVFIVDFEHISHLVLRFCSYKFNVTQMINTSRKYEIFFNSVFLYISKHQKSC